MPLSTEYKETAKILYTPSEKAQAAINHVYDRLYTMQYTRDRKYNYLNDRSLVTYIDDSTKRWNGYIPPRDDLTMDWQARVFNNFTRNVVISFLSKAAMQRPKAKFTATNKEGGFEDVKRAHILEKLHEYSQNREQGEWKFFLSALECVTKGTVIAYEGYRKIKRKIKEVALFNPITGEIKYNEKEVIDYDDCYRHIVPLEDMYVGNVWQQDVQLQPDVCWKSIMRRVEAEEEFKKYKEWRYVLPGAYTSLVEQTPFYKNKIYAELESDQVEILRYFNRLKDQMIIVANGVLLYDGPIPFSHKMYPFSKGIYEPFAADFFYGKSLPDKIATDQDVINTLWNMGLDQQYLSIFKPILTDDPDEVEETVLVPGLVRKVNDINRYRVMNELQGPDASYFNMLQLALNFAKDNSGPQMGGGSLYTPRGGKITARQALLAEEQARQVMGLSVKMLEKYERDCVELRVKNILQFFSLPGKIEEVSGTTEDEYRRAFMRVIRLDDVSLSDKSHGREIIKFVENEEMLPSSEEIQVEEEMSALQGENVEVHVVTPEYIRNLDFDVQIVGESTYLQSKSIQQAMGLEFYQLMNANPLINKEELTREALKLYEKDPDRFMQQMPPQGMPIGGGMPPGGALPAGGETPEVAAQVLGRGEAKSLQSLAGVGI